MNRYTYTLNPGQKEPEMKQTYKRSRLEQMTTFQLKEICRKERLVLPSGAPDRDGLVRLIMRSQSSPSSVFSAVFSSITTGGKPSYLS